MADSSSRKIIREYINNFKNNHNNAKYKNNNITTNNKAIRNESDRS